jgi:ABC-2 type transport system permease protein
MMTILQNSFANSSSSLTQSKITGNLIFILLSPISNFKIFLAYSIASAMRGLVVGFVMALSIFFIFGYEIHNLTLVILYSFFGSITLGVLGIIAGILTEKFDQLAAFQNFIIMPMTFLAGVFYSVESLPNPWKTVSQFNPFYYIVDGFRYGFIGHSDFNPYFGLCILISFFLICSFVTIFLLKIGYKLRN